MRTIQIRNVESKIKIDSFTIFNLIIENTTFLRNLVLDLSNDAESFEYLGENKTTFANDSYFIFNLFDVTLDSKKADSTLQKELSSRITYEQKEKFESLKLLVYDYINSITYDYPIPVSYNDDFPLSTLLKSINVTPEITSSSIVEEVIQNIKILSYLLKKDIFVIFNLKDFFSNEELVIFFKAMEQLEIKILLISSHSSLRLENEQQIIIDKDLCELHIPKEI